MARVKVLNQHHPDHPGDRLQILMALASGDMAFERIRAKLIGKYYAEPEEVYKERLGLSTYTNHAGPILSRLAGLLFSEAPAVEGMEKGFFDLFVENVDRIGSPLARFFHERFMDALIGGVSFVWVDLPNAEGLNPTTRAEQDLLGLRKAYLIPLTLGQVINWGTDATGNLSWVMVRDVLSRQDSPTSPRQIVWRWRAIDATSVTSWEWVQRGESPPEPEKDLGAGTRLEHGLGRLPVVRFALPEPLQAMSRLAHPALKLLRADNELGWALHQAANELLVVLSRSDGGTPTLGHGYYLSLGRDGTGQDDAFYVAPSGVAFEHLESRVKDSREELYRVVSQIALAADSDSNRAGLSGESKAQDWKALEMLLGAYARMIKGFIREVMRLVALARGEAPEDITIKGLSRWKQEDLIAFLESCALATEARQLSPTFVRVLAKRQAERLLGDEVDEATLDTIRKEIDEADDTVIQGAFTTPNSPNESEA